MISVCSAKPSGSIPSSSICVHTLNASSHSPARPSAPTTDLREGVSIG